MITGITPVQKKSGGGLLSKITGSAGGLGGLIGGGVGLLVGGPAGGKAGMSLGSTIGGAAQSAGALADKSSTTQSSQLQGAASSNPNLATLKVANAIDAANSSMLPENERAPIVNHLTESLNVLKQRNAPRIG